MSSGVVALGALVPRISSVASASDSSEPFEWITTNLILPFEVTAGKLRQKRIVPAGIVAAGAGNSSGVEVALQCSGENSPDQGMKSGVGNRVPDCFLLEGTWSPHPEASAWYASIQTQS